MAAAEHELTLGQDFIDGTYMAECSCGWESAARNAASDAIADWRNHGEYNASEYPDGHDAPRYGYRGAAEIEKLRAERDRYRAALDDLNRLRSNITATQSASWSNAMYPLVAILDRAGFGNIDDVTPEDMADHMLCYGGAGGSPNHPTPDCRVGDLWKQRRDEAAESGTALQRLHKGAKG